jgi:hypothetical protein
MNGRICWYLLLTWKFMAFMVSDIDHIVATLLSLIGGQHWGVLQWRNYRAQFCENRSVGTKAEVVTALTHTVWLCKLYFFSPLDEGK